MMKWKAPPEDPQEQFSLPDADSSNWLNHPCPDCGATYSFLIIKYKKSVRRMDYHLECARPSCGLIGPEFKTSQDAIAHWRLAAKLSK